MSCKQSRGLITFATKLLALRKVLLSTDLEPQSQYACKACQHDKPSDLNNYTGLSTCNSQLRASMYSTSNNSPCRERLQCKAREAAGGAMHVGT